jgi:hypothetical protein
MRKLDEQFMSDLKEGILNGVRNVLFHDSTLDFQIRDNQVHIYYRGGKIWDIKKTANRYSFYFDTNYCKDWTSWTINLQEAEAEAMDIKNRIINLPTQVTSAKDIDKWIFSIPFLKQTMDEYFSKNPKTEREYQQHVTNENNNFQVSGGTDYFIVDIEYANREGRFDMVSILWPSKGTLRKLQKGYQPELAFIEMKFGDGALSGNAGLKKHVSDIDTFLGTDENFKEIRKEMQTIFKQKRELGLFLSLTNNSNEIKAISEKKPQFILLLSAHDPESKKLINELVLLPDPKNCDLKIAVANFMGYGLYQEAMYNLDDFRKYFSKQIYSNS